MHDIVQKVIESKLSAQRVSPCHVNRASSLGHPCERYLVYCRTEWDKRTLPDVVLEFIFAGGRMIEKLALEELEAAGFNPSNQGRDFHDKDFQISGHIDCMLDIERQLYPCEIKGISPFEFNKIDSTDDMIHSKKVWLRAYPAQLQIYLYLSNHETGLFYIKDKLTFKPKAIWMQIDYEFCDGLLKKAKRINQHVSAKTLPERITEFDICVKCQFKHICLPELRAIDGLEIIDSDELEQKIDRWAELKEGSSEYCLLDKEIKKLVEGKDNLLVGKWYITGKHITVKKEAQPATETQYWKKKIVKVE